MIREVLAHVDPRREVGMTIYCQEPSTLHRVCPGYSTTTLQETVGAPGKRCGCSCHNDGSNDGSR